MTIFVRKLLTLRAKQKSRLSLSGCHGWWDDVTRRSVQGITWDPEKPVFAVCKEPSLRVKTARCGFGASLDWSCPSLKITPSEIFIERSHTNESYTYSAYTTPFPGLSLSLSLSLSCSLTHARTRARPHTHAHTHTSGFRLTKTDKELEANLRPFNIKLRFDFLGILNP